MRSNAHREGPEPVDNPRSGKKRASESIETQRTTTRSRLKKWILIAVGIAATAGSSAYFLSRNDGHRVKEPGTNKKNAEKDVPLELSDRTLLDHSVIRIGIRSNPQEKERMRSQIKRALSIALADPQILDVYTKSQTEQIVTPDLAHTIRDVANLAGNAMNHFNDGENPSHGDAYTIAIESRGNDGSLRESKNFMFLRIELLNPENFPQLLFTIDHECRHLLFRGMNLSRRDEEIQVYTSSIARMQEVALALQKRGGEDAEIGKRILHEVLPVHNERLRSWQTANIPNR